MVDLQGETVGLADEQLIQVMLYVKDKYNVTGQGYHELAAICKQMPRHYRLKRKISELSVLWELHVFPTPNGTCGVQQNLRDRPPFERMVYK